MVNPLYKAARKSAGRFGSFKVEEEPEESLLRKVGRGTLSGLAAVGNLLDLGGSSVRDLLAGENPVDQFLTPFSSDNRTTGRDLLRKAGLAGKKDTWGNFGAGLALEIAADPLTYATFGASALSKAGTVAKAAGLAQDITGVASKLAGRELGKGVGRRVAQRMLTPRMLIESAPDATKAASAFKTAGGTADLLDKPLGGMLGYKIPFTKIQGTIPLGKHEGRIAETLDAVSDVVRHGKYSPIRALTPIFSKAVKGATQKIGMTFGRAISKGEEAATEYARRRFAPHLAAFERSGVLDAAKVAKRLGVKPDVAQRQVVENALKMSDYLEEVGDWTNLPAELEPLRGSLDDMKSAMREVFDAAQAEGLDPSALRDVFIQYYPRVKTMLDQPTFGAGKDRAAASLFNQHDIARREELRGLTGGTSEIQRASLDPVLSGFAHKLPGKKITAEIMAEKVKYVKEKYPDLVAPQPMNVEQSLKTAVPVMGKRMGGKVAPTSSDINPALKNMVSNVAEAEDISDQQIRQLVSTLAYQDPKHAELGIPLYKLNPVETGLGRMEHGMRTVAAAKGLREMLTQAATVKEAIGADPYKIPKLGIDTPSPDDVPLSHVMSQLGFRGENAKQVFADSLRANRRFDEILGRAFEAGAQMPTDPNDVDWAFNYLYVPKEIADDAGRMMKTFQSPEEVGVLLSTFDQFTRLFKSGVTSVFPAFHSRNALSGIAQNFIIGAGDPSQMGPMKYIKPLKEMDALLSGETIADATKIPVIQKMGITDPAEATEVLRRMMFETGATGHQGALAEAANFAGNLSEEMPGLRPGPLSVRRPGASLLEIARQATPRNLSEANPLNIAGVRSNVDVFKPVAAGRKLGGYTEDMVRGAGFIGLLRQGVDPSEAARRVRAAHVDYKNLTGAEKVVLRRIAPFYAFTKGAVTNLTQTLLGRPGGRLGQGIRAINAARDPDGMTPDYVAETAAIPLPGAPEGTDRYLTGFGLQFEDPLSFLGGGPSGVLLEALSRANPAVKAPLELATGQTFFQKGPMGGRPLEDLDPTVGRLAANLLGREKPVTFPGSRTAEFVLGNSPVSRLLTTARQASDPRKGIGSTAVNLLTGARISDVSPGAQDAILRERVQQLLKTAGGKSFARTYVPKEDLEAMPPEQQEQVRELQNVLNILAKRAKARKKN